jgi:hypothetical protein
MSCPPKFKDLHKSNDDAFKKDFHQDCFNTKIENNYDYGSYGHGKMTTKFDFKSDSSAPACEIEFKHDSTEGYLKGITTTKTINSGELVKIKMEKSKDNMKYTLKLSQNLGNWFKTSSPELSINYGKNNLSTQLDITPAKNWSGLDSVNLDTTFKAGSVNLGLALNYALNKKALSHHVKLNKSCSGFNCTFGLKGTENLELIMSKKISGHVNLLGLTSWDNKMAHFKSAYNINSPNDWKADLCLEYENGILGRLGCQKGKAKLDLKNLAYHETANLAVNDSLGVTIGYGSKLDGNFFNAAKMGASLNFKL